MPLKFGVMGRGFPPIEAVLETSEKAEALGFDFIDHSDQIQSTHPLGMLPRPTNDSVVASTWTDEWFESFQLMTASALKTDRVELVLGVIDALRRGPATLAMSLATLSHLSHGRSTVAFATGESKQFEPYGEGHLRSKPMERFEESLRIMNALWDAGREPVTRDSEFWPLKDAVFPLELFEGKKPTILTVGGGPTLEALTAELADGWLTYLPGGVEDDVKTLKNAISSMKDQAARIGRDPEALQFHGMTLVDLAEDDETAWRYVNSPSARWATMIGASITSTKTWEKWGLENPLGKVSWSLDASVTTWSPAEAEELCKQVPDEALAHGSVWGGPERVANRIQQFADAGLTHVCFLNRSPQADPDSARDFVPLVSDVMVRLGGDPLNLDIL